MKGDDLEQALREGAAYQARLLTHSEPVDVCPWCGGLAAVSFVHVGRLRYMVQCRVCGAWGPVGDSVTAAIVQWNGGPGYV